MPYYETSQEWLRQSALLLEARPSTTRITTSYHLTDKTGSSKKRQKRRQQQQQQQQEQQSSATTTTTTTPSAAAPPPPPRASLTIKTYDPHSGACLKYRTTKAAEVSRLILSLGQLGRKMAALPADADTIMADVGAAEEVGTPGLEKAEPSTGGNAGAKGQAQTQTQGQGQGQAGGGGGGKGKKKRGKK
ncbi:signal recognition particle 9 kDa protein-domain-containing protein [Xylaria sp. FL1042]|nr:signal recognition particle 9 kDa protein-domain-containing protein [Xylaria sp. FL1042]